MILGGNIGGQELEAAFDQANWHMVDELHFR
jgi:hypothetical protein